MANVGHTIIAAAGPDELKALAESHEGSLQNAVALFPPDDRRSAMPSTLMFPEASPTYFRELAEGHRLVRAIRDAAEAAEAASCNHEFGYVDWINPDMISEDVLISRSIDASRTLDAAVAAALAHPLARRILAAQRIPCATADDRSWIGYRMLHGT